MNLIDRISARQIGLAVGVFTLIVSLWISWRIFYIELENEHHHLEHEAVTIRNQLESALSQAVNATSILAYLAENQLLDAHFDSISHDLLQKNRYIDALQLVEGRTIVRTYPLDGNESVIGYSVLDNPAHLNAAVKAYERGTLYFEGPFQLRQGWNGFVGRQPIHRDGALWGFAAALLRYETFLRATGLDSTGRNGQFIYQLAKVGPDGAPTTLLFPDNEPLTGGITYSIGIPVGDWLLTVGAANPSQWRHTIPFVLMGLILSIVLGYLAYTLARQPEQLQREVNQRTRELRISRNEIERFAYVSSHELQDPLRSMISHMRHIRTRFADNLDSKAIQHLDFSIESGERMNRITLDLMRLSKAGTTEEPLTEVDLSDVTTYLKTLFRKKNGRITLTEPAIIRAKRDAFIQVMESLVGNALTYSKPGTTPNVTISVTDTDAEWVVTVRDDGVGIHSDKMDTLFQLFPRLDSGRPGTGIGLAVARKIVEHDGGRVWAESEFGQGSQFHFSILKNPPQKPE